MIDGSSLTKTYYQLTAGERQSEFGTLFVKSSFVLQSTTYSELGIENEKDLIDALNSDIISCAAP